MSKTIVILKNVEKSFMSGKEKINVLRSINLEVEEGEFITITGPSGSGKSTLLHILGGLLHPDSGDVILQGKPLYKYKDAELARIRNEKIGFIFQFHHLLFDFSVLENLAIPLLIRGSNLKRAYKKAEELLSLVDLEHRVHAKPRTLSGGERQRVAVLRAIVNDPLLLLADEPTGDLDQAHSDVVLKMLSKIQRESGMTVILVSHNQRVAQMGKKTYNLVEGKLK
ncbi:MAG: ABC transporter ATP-binding protein [candidate division WOR-3 bacterium]|jgi:lipoprotein-releasing system ATP-binding protein